MKDLAVECISGSHSLHIREKTQIHPRMLRKLLVCNVLLTFCHHLGICLEILTLKLKTEMMAS